MHDADNLVAAALRSAVCSREQGTGPQTPGERVLRFAGASPLDDAAIELIRESCSTLPTAAKDVATRFVNLRVRPDGDAAAALVWTDVGRSLAEVCGDFALRLELVAVVEALAALIARAGELGLVHRFLSPEVVIAYGGGEWGVAGFGVVQALERVAWRAASVREPEDLLDDPFLVRTATPVHPDDRDGILRLCAWMLVRDPGADGALVPRVPWPALAAMNVDDILAFLHANAPSGPPAPLFRAWCEAVATDELVVSNAIAVSALRATLGLPLEKTVDAAALPASLRAYAPIHHEPTAYAQAAFAAQPTSREAD
jgi:hypothetical protein